MFAGWNRYRFHKSCSSVDNDRIKKNEKKSKKKKRKRRQIRHRYGALAAFLPGPEVHWDLWALCRCWCAIRFGTFRFFLAHTQTLLYGAWRSWHQHGDTHTSAGGLQMERFTKTPVACCLVCPRLSFLFTIVSESFSLDRTKGTAAEGGGRARLEQRPDKMNWAEMQWNWEEIVYFLLVLGLPFPPR